MRPCSTKKAAALATLALFGLTSAAVVARGFENGSFDEGLAGWKAESAHRAIGLAEAYAELGTMDLRGGETLASMRIYARAGSLVPSSGPGGAAVSLARLRQDIEDIPYTVLTFDWAAGLWGEISGRGSITYQARLIVERTSPPLRHEFDLLEQSTWSGGSSCGPAMVMDGRPYDRAFYTDLSAVGFEPGDDIRVSVEARARARALRSCDIAAFGCTLMVDQFALRRSTLVERTGRRLSASQPGG